MRILRAREVVSRTGLSRTSIWRMERRGEFPARRRLHGGRVGWLETEVEQWIDGRPVIEPGANRARALKTT